MKPHTPNTALLVMDMQNAILGMIPDAPLFSARVSKAIAHARASRIPLLYVIVGFREGMPEINPNNKSFAARKHASQL